MLFGAKGKLVAHTQGIDVSPTLEQVVTEFEESLAERQTYQDLHLYKIMVEGEMEYVLVCQVPDETYAVYAQMAVCQIRNLVMSFAEQFDRNNFIQNILLGNMLIVDIYGKAKKHHIVIARIGKPFDARPVVAPRYLRPEPAQTPPGHSPLKTFPSDIRTRPAPRRPQWTNRAFFLPPR